MTLTTSPAGLCERLTVVQRGGHESNCSKGWVNLELTEHRGGGKNETLNRESKDEKRAGEEGGGDRNERCGGDLKTQLVLARGGEKREMCNYQPRAEHMSAGLYWNRDEPRADRFYNFISCTDLSFAISREIATHTLWHSLSQTHTLANEDKTYCS